MTDQPRSHRIHQDSTEQADAPEVVQPHIVSPDASQGPWCDPDDVPDLDEVMRQLRLEQASE
jgi:hypothetical protein